MAHFAIPSHVLIGTDALKEGADYLKEYGKKALIVTGKHVGKSPMMGQLIALLEHIGIAYYIFDEITGEPTDKMIEQGLSCYQQQDCQFVIGIGGGSPLDSAKAIAAMAVNQGKIADYNGTVIIGSVPPIVAIPTTAGTGSEATKFTIITDQENDIKMLLKGDCLVPSLAILNYEYTMDMPRSVTVATGLDALTHAIEAYTSRKASVLTDIYACSAVRRIFRYLPDAYRNGYDAMARKQMAIAAFEAGVCINNSSVTLVHGMSRPIGALFHVPHGMSNAMLLKECLEFAMDVELPLEVMYYSKEERSQRADEMLEMVGLTNFANHFPKQLSGGMQQRVNIARAFGLRPEILLMDEPFSALDEFTKEKLHEDLLRIWRQTNKTILFVTHNIQEAVFLSSRVCVLSPHPGRLSAVVDIDLPRPRTLDMKDTVHFNELVAKVRNSFEGGSV